MYNRMSRWALKAALAFIFTMGSHAGTCTCEVPLDYTWPMFRHDPYHTGLSSASGDMDTCRLIWTYETGYDPHNLSWVSSSTVLGDIDADGRLEVVVGAWDDFLHALNGEDGSVLWTYHPGGDVISTPALADIDADGRLEVAVGGYDLVYAVNGEDGSLLWQERVGNVGHVVSSPVIGDLDGDGSPEVTIGFGYGVCALNGVDGNVLWWYPNTGRWSSSSPALGDIDGDGYPEVVVGGADGRIHALNGEDGSILWLYRTDHYVYSSPAISDIDGDGKLEVVTGSGGDVYALTGENGNLLWSYHTAGGIVSCPALGDVDEDGRLEVVIGSTDWNVYAFNGEDGTLLWSYQTGWPVESSPALGDVDGDDRLEVIVGSLDCTLYALDGENGSLLWSFGTVGMAQWSPSLGDIDGDGRLEVVYNGRDLMVYALDGPACEPVEPPLMRTQGYWRRQCKDDSHESICAYADSIHALADVFDTFNCDSVCDLMDVVPPERDMCRKASRQLMTLLLNIASGKLAVCNCLEDGRRVGGIIGEIDLLLSGDPDFHTCVRAKTLADDINNGIGVVPCDTTWTQTPPRAVQPPSISATPNPFSKSTVIEYELKAPGHVRLDIYDKTGRLVRNLIHDEQNEGLRRVRWDGLSENRRLLPEGIYFFSLQSRHGTVGGSLIFLGRD